MDTKNIIEVLDAVEVIAIPAKQAFKDGIDFSDLPKLLEIVKKHEVLLAAIDNIGAVVDEAKDLSPEEAAQVVFKVISVIKNIKEA